MSKALLVHEEDNVAVALEALQSDTTVEVASPAGSVKKQVQLQGAVPFGHKLAICPIASGAAVIKYGQAIGVATTDIAPGEHVHVHNVASGKGRGDLGKE